MPTDFVKIYTTLFTWCKREDFAGFDPFDGLNSSFFQATPLKHFALPRLFWLQMVKRSPANLRSFLKIEKGINAKGMALFALAELARFRETKNDDHLENTRFLLDYLVNNRITNESGNKCWSAFGYNFDWQSRAFYAPRGTPTIVPTAFACQAFIEAFEVCQDPRYLEIATEICEFIVSKLNRVEETEDELCFSYTPLDQSVIFNASLLAGECLAKIGVITQNANYLNLSEKTANYVLRRQQPNGSWAYGSKLRHKWVDNFHTAYVLLSLYRLQKLIPRLQNQSGEVLKKGYHYWIEKFFLNNGTAKYYDQKTYPIDIHSATAAVVALAELNEFDQSALPLAEMVLHWTCRNMRDPEGFFYYQKRENGIIKTPFIRWSQSWTAFAIAKFIEKKKL